MSRKPLLPQNAAPQDAHPVPARNAKGHLLPGHTANPGGRTKKFKGLAKMIRAATNDGADLVDFAVEVFANTNTSIAYTHSQRWDAMQWLTDRGFGKAIAPTIELGAEDEGAAMADLDLASALAGKSNDELDRDANDIDTLLARMGGSGQAH